MVSLATGYDMLKGFSRFVRGRRYVHYYYATVSGVDSLLALFYSICVLMNLPIGRDGRERLKKAFLNKYGPRDLYFYGSARSALCSHLRCLNYEKDSEVIVTGYTCDVVPNAIIQTGLKPVFADIDEDTYCISPESVRTLVNEKTRVLIIQHTYGIPAKIDELKKIAEDYGLYLIEDCAVALGTLYKGKPAGTFGDAAIISFELSKTITSARGGALFINTNERDGKHLHKLQYDKVPEQGILYSSNLLFQFGLSGVLYRPVIYNIGKYLCALLYKYKIFKKSTPDEEFNARISKHYFYKLSDQQARLLLRQLKLIDVINEASKAASDYYDEFLKGIYGLKTHNMQACEDCHYSLIRYPILIEHRDMFLKAMVANSIDDGLWFSAPISSPDVDATIFGYEAGSCPAAEEVAGRMLNLPTNVRLRRSDLERIVGLCRSVANGINA